MNDVIAPIDSSAMESAATTELRSILSDPLHRLHEPLMRGDPQVNEYLDGLYRGASQGGPSATKDPSSPPRLPTPPMEQPITLEERVATTAYDDFLRQYFGEEYDGVMSSMGSGARALFTTPEARQALEVFSDAIIGLGPHAEILGIRFLSDLGHLVQAKQQGGHS